ncbi:MAG: electron transfer flavoprotein subunit alpha/FixB family protein [Elusimicrobiota bacterium]
MNKKALIIIKENEEKELNRILNLLDQFVSERKTVVISISEKGTEIKNKDFLLKSDNFFNENITSELLKIIAEIGPQIIISSSSNEIKNLMAQIAIELKSGILTDCHSLILENGNLYAEKYAYGGDISARLISLSETKIITINASDNSSNELIEKKFKEILVAKSSKIETISKEKKESELTPDKSDKVIGVGRGVRAEDISLIKKFASSIKAAVGYTRPLIHEGVANHDYQIGITGKIISPKLYIAIGISGKEYHIKGIEKAKTIISVNTDPNAPIKKISDYFICLDYKNFLQKILTEK